MSSEPATWIEESLSHLESLEAERADRETALESTEDVAELRMHAKEIERLDGEIRGLYAALEAIADDEDNESANSTSGYPQLEDYDPFGPPPSQTGMFSADVVADETFGEDACDGANDPPLLSIAEAPDEPHPRFSGETLKWAGIAAGAFAMLVVAVVALSGGESEEPTATGPTQVIEAGAIPEDTQEPKAAVGADVDRTPDRKIIRSKRRHRRGPWRPEPGPISGPSAADKEGKIAITRTTDPIAGVH